MKNRIIAIVLIVTILGLAHPADALAPTVFARVIDQAALFAAKKLAVREATALAIQAGAGVASGSLLVKIVTGGSGWIGLGVMVGLAVLEWQYSAAQQNTIWLAASPESSCGTVTIGSNNYNVHGCNYTGVAPTQILKHRTDATETCGNGSPVSATSNGFLYWDYFTELTITNPIAGGTCNSTACGDRFGWPPSSNGYSRQISGNANPTLKLCLFHGHTSTNSATSPTFPHDAATLDTIGQVLDSADPNGLEAQQQPKGLGAPELTGATTSTVNLTSTEVSTQVKPESQVNTDDIVVSKTQVAPDGTTVEDTGTTTVTGDTTTTTTTTTNEDGSTTTVTTSEESDTAAVSCDVGSSDTKTLSSVILGHINTWRSSPILQSLSTAYTVAFPSTLPTVSLTSHFFST